MIFLEYVGSRASLSAETLKISKLKNYTQLYTLQSKAGRFVFQSSNL